MRGRPRGRRPLWWTTGSHQVGPARVPRRRARDRSPGGGAARRHVPARAPHAGMARRPRGRGRRGGDAVDAQLQLSDAAADRWRDAHQHEPGVRCGVSCVLAGGVDECPGVQWVAQCPADVAGAGAQVVAVVVAGAGCGDGEIVRARTPCRPDTARSWADRQGPSVEAPFDVPLLIAHAFDYERRSWPRKACSNHVTSAYAAVTSEPLVSAASDI